MTVLSDRRRGVISRRVVSRRAAELSLIAVAFLASATNVAAQGMDDPRPTPSYGSTLTNGTGLVTIPVAWISPGNGDLFAMISARNVGWGPAEVGRVHSNYDLTQSVDAHLGGRVSIGLSLYSSERQQLGFSGQWLALERPKSGGPVWLPSVALGFRNLGSSKYQDRYATGGRRAVDFYGGVNNTTGRGVINGSPTLYGVATREFSFEKSAASFSIGYGNGLFKEDGGLDSNYSKSGTLASGVFLGGRYVWQLSGGRTLAVMLDNNGFDWNGGINFTTGFISLGVYQLEMEEGQRPETGKTRSLRISNFSKIGFAIGYNASLPGIILGSRTRAEAADAQLELRRLQQEVDQRLATTKELNAQLAKAAAAADAATRSRQESLQKQLEAERAALKAASERLDAMSKKPPEPR